MDLEAGNRPLGDNRSRSDASFLERKIQNLTLRRTGSESVPDLTGPLGLTLLSQPSVAFVDFIFVHGLRGGSRKTWSATSSQAHYWPKEWLPSDPAFKHVRIHTFGYDSDWADRKDSFMNVHDFGQSLLEDIKSCPTIPRDSGTAIVLIGHSLGGLVIKKACIAAKENPVFHNISKRIHSLYFLATPHRGSDLARTLNNVVRASFSTAKPYVSNLKRGSEAIQVLNDQFRHCHSAVQIHTFIESVGMNVGFGSVLIVDRESATLGYDNERIQTLNANHRTVCKFEHPTDHNYRTLRNRLASTVEDIVKNVAAGKHHRYRDQMVTLSNYLGIPRNFQYELSALEDDRLPGTCEWLTNKINFQEWQFLDESPRYFWLKGRPATGKSMLATHVISSLQGAMCSYYFFKHGNHERSSLSGFFRSIAYQMAGVSLSVREKLLEIVQEDSVMDRDDYQTIWRKLFVEGIFRAPFHHVHYWVVDALDECSAAERHNYDNLFTMLSKIDNRVFLKVFMTSRPSSDLERLLLPLPVVSEQIKIEDSQRDIELYVQTNSDSLPVEDSDTRQELSQKILRKSCGCFLWTVLVMQQLQDVYSLEEIEEVLEEVPQEMEPLYHRNLSIMSKNNRTKKLAATILLWAVCATRPLSIGELKDAIKLDIGNTLIRDLEGSISPLCGQLVYVDKTAHVQIMHQTARAFLLNPDLDSEFRVDTPAANLQLAQACLKYLTSDEMAFTMKRKSVVSLAREPPRNTLASYASNSFSEHILRASSASSALYRQLTLFLRTNILSWIEHIAEVRDLSTIIRTGKHLNAYLLRRIKHSPVLQDDIGSWATDLPRIATEFGGNLLNTPSAIHTLVPPFCPSNSIIYKHFNSKPDSLTKRLDVRGLSYQDWHDRISCINYRDSTPKAVACKDHNFVIGLTNGLIELYKTLTCEHIRRLRHGEVVRILRFGHSSRNLASAGLRSVKLWDTSAGSCLLDIAMNTNPMALAFDEQGTSLIIATRSKELITWQIGSTVATSHCVWDDRLPGRTPTEVLLSTEHGLIAMVYRGLPVNLWSMETQQLLGSCSRVASNRTDSLHNIIAVVFNPNPDIWLLAVAYWDGELTVYDTLRRTMKCSTTSDAQKLAVSPDGRTLVGGSNAGKVQLYDFESLQLLYNITLSGDHVAALAFTSDSLRFLDLRGSQANVWEPSVLVRKDADDGISEPSDAMVPTAIETSAKPYEQMAIINTLIVINDGAAAICGRNNGVVDVLDLLSPEEPARQLYKHKGSFAEVLLLAYSHSKRILLSVDNSSHFRVVQLACKDSTDVESQLLEERLESQDPISQAVFSTDGTNLLLSTSKQDILWSLSSKRRVTSFKHEEARQTWKWYTTAQRPEEIFLAEASSVQSYDWTTLAQSSDPIPLSLEDENRTLEIDDIFADATTHCLIFKSIMGSSKTHFSVLQNSIHLKAVTQVSSLPLSSTVSRPTALLPTERTPKRPEVDIMIAILQGDYNTYSLVFLSQSGWVCSVELDPSKSAPQDNFKRHFFVPLAWLSTSTKLIVRVTEKRDVIFVRGEELAVVRNGFENEEVIEMGEDECEHTP